MARWWRCRAVSSREGMAAPAALNTPSRPSRAYPELFAVVGSRIPDLQGVFLRGHGGNSAALGVRQGDAMRQLTGTISSRYFLFEEGSGSFSRSGGYGRLYANNSGGDIASDIVFDNSRQTPTAEENRPVNQAVRYLIRAR